LSTLSPVWASIAASPEGEVADALSHASALYYEARFKESIDLLLRVDDLLRPQQSRIQEKVAVQLQLAIAYVGLKDMNEARAHFNVLFALKPDYNLDTQQFSPKVISLANDAKTEQNEIRARMLCEETLRQLETGNVTGLDQIATMKPKCAGLAAAAS